MTTWLEGDQFPYPHDRRFCLEIGEHQVWGYVRDGVAFYTVRYWEDGITKWTPETLVTSGVDDHPVFTGTVREYPSQDEPGSRPEDRGLK